MNAKPGLQASVIMVVDDHVSLPETVRAYARQTAPRESFEVIAFDPVRLVDWATTVRELLADAPDLNFQFAPLPTKGRAQALNLGVQRAQAPLIIFGGDDVVPGPTFIEAHLDYHRKHPELTAVGIGSTLFPERLRADPFRAWLDDSGALFGVQFHGPATRLPRNCFYIANASVKRGLLEKAGSFHEGFRHHTCDDYELSLRLAACGMRAGYVHGAEALHEHEVTLPERCESVRQAGEATRTLLALHPEANPWEEVLAKDPAAHERTALYYQLCAWLLGKPKYQHQSWQATLHAAFVRGYRGAQSPTAAEAA